MESLGEELFRLISGGSELLVVLLRVIMLSVGASGIGSFDGLGWTKENLDEANDINANYLPAYRSQENL